MKRLFLFWLIMTVLLVSLDVMFLDWSVEGITVILALCLANAFICKTWLDLWRA
ncbi:hypothetical protein [uncultured Selenomonas sp.]|uniref:hypothetical protein n=1 Tax=uncultured Selenomonas sp. TaxID=159275 RepID=UPI00261E5916|nr:hypothetical protein [uncultured Selenomonas sp.]